MASFPADPVGESEEKYLRNPCFGDGYSGLREHRDLFERNISRNITLTLVFGKSEPLGVFRCATPFAQQALPQTSPVGDAQRIPFMDREPQHLLYVIEQDLDATI